MNSDETKAFLEAYPTVIRYQEAAQEQFSKMLLRITERVILDSEECATRFDERKADPPCLYNSLSVQGWHIPGNSLFVFLDIVRKQIGLIANGYQSPKEKQDFLPLWNDKLKQRFRDNPGVQAFTWINKGDDDEGYDYFKLIAGTSGKLFDPDKLDAFKEYFYWGYCYPLEIDMLNEPLFAKIASDAKKLISSFNGKGNGGSCAQMPKQLRS